MLLCIHLCFQMESCLNSHVEDCRSNDRRIFREIISAAEKKLDDSGYYSDDDFDQPQIDVDGDEFNYSELRLYPSNATEHRKFTNCVNNTYRDACWFSRYKVRYHVSYKFEIQLT